MYCMAMLPRHTRARFKLLVSALRGAICLEMRPDLRPTATLSVRRNEAKS